MSGWRAPPQAAVFPRAGEEVFYPLRGVHLRGRSSFLSSIGCIQAVATQCLIQFFYGFYCLQFRQLHLQYLFYVTIESALVFPVDYSLPESGAYCDNTFCKIRFVTPFFSQ